MSTPKVSRVQYFRKRLGRPNGGGTVYARLAGGADEESLRSEASGEVGDLRTRVTQAMCDAYNEANASSTKDAATPEDFTAEADAVLAVVTPELERLAAIAKAAEYVQGPESCFEQECEDFVDEAGSPLDPAPERCSHMTMRYATGDDADAAFWQAEAIRGLESERDALRADMGIRQGALNDVLDRDRSQNSPTDYYDAVEDVAELKRALALAEQRIAKTLQALTNESFISSQASRAAGQEEDEHVPTLAALKDQRRGYTRTSRGAPSSPSAGEADTTPLNCGWYQWMSGWTSCDRCARPAWEHEGMASQDDGPWADEVHHNFSPAQRRIFAQLGAPNTEQEAEK